MYKPTPKNNVPKNDSSQQGSKNIPLVNLVDDFFALIQSNETNDQNYTVGKDDPVAYEKFADNLIASWEKLEKKVGKEVSQDEIMSLKTAQWKSIEKKFFSNTYSFLSDDPVVLHDQVMKALQKIAPTLETNTLLRLDNNASLSVLKNLAVMEERWINLEAKINKEVSLEDAINWTETIAQEIITPEVPQQPNPVETEEFLSHSSQSVETEQFSEPAIIQENVIEPLQLVNSIEVTPIVENVETPTIAPTIEEVTQETKIVEAVAVVAEVVTTTVETIPKEQTVQSNDHHETMMALLLNAYCLNCEKLQDNSEKSVAKIAQLNSEWKELETTLGHSITQAEVFKWEKDEDIKVANKKLCDIEEPTVTPEPVVKKEPAAKKKTAKAKKEEEAAAALLANPIDDTPKKLMGFMLRRK